MPTCALCLADVSEFADSHVYPLALHKQMHSEDMPAFTVHAKPTHPARTAVKSRKGTHGYFVCHPCEHDLFQEGDNEFMKLYHRLDKKPLPVREGDRSRLVTVPGDPGLIHRFALQTLWRWFACPEAALDRAEIGPLYDRLRGWLLQPGSTLRSGWGVAVQHSQGSLTMAALPPAVIIPRGERSGRFLILTVPRFLFYIALDRCWLPGRFADITLRAGSSVNMVLSYDFPNIVVEGFAHVFKDGGLERTEAFVERFQAKKS